MFGIDKNKPNPRRYLKQHGTGVTDYGISRALKLLPAMEAIGDPVNGSSVTKQDLADVKSCLEAYKYEGQLQVIGIAARMWSDMGVYDSTDKSAVDRLDDQRLPDGCSKYRYAFRAVPMAMTPSNDLMHEGWWHMAADMCGNRNMEEVVDEDAAGAFLAGWSEMDKGAGVDGMAEKLADAWKGLDLAAPCTMPGNENSVRRTQFCALQAAAYLDGYDFMPDEDQARKIGQIVKDGFKDEDMKDFKAVIARSLYEHPQPQAELGYPDREPIKSETKPSAMDRLRQMMDEGNGRSAGSEPNVTVREREDDGPEL